MPFSCAVSKVCFFWTKTPSRRGSGSSLCCHILPVVWLIFFLSARAALAWRVARAMSDPGGKLSVARSRTTTLLRMMRYVSELRLLSSAVLCFLFLPFRTVGMYFENTVLHVAQAGGCSSPVVASTRTRRRCHSWGIFFFFTVRTLFFQCCRCFVVPFFPYGTMLTAVRDHRYTLGPPSFSLSLMCCLWAPVASTLMHPAETSLLGCLFFHRRYVHIYFAFCGYFVVPFPPLINAMLTAQQQYAAIH